MNISAAKNILQQLASVGVETLCVCPGARNAPFIKLLSESSGFEVLSFYDERSAGFFGLGRARRDSRPVAIFTTSGTAVSELLSPVIEAHYTNTPLIVISSDRPKRLRGTGAPQAIEQAQIFNSYVEKSWDISADESLSLEMSFLKPVHINICFDEPLVDNEDVSENFEISPAKSPKTQVSQEKHSALLEKAMILVGGLHSDDQSSVEKALSDFDVPMYLESLSGLSNSSLLKDRVISGGEKLVSQMLKSGEIENVVRIGDIPVGRFWRDLDQLQIPTLSISDKSFRGTEKSQLNVQSLNELSLRDFEIPEWDFSHWLQKGKIRDQEISHLIEKYPSSEVSCFRKLSEQIPEDQSVYLGNSLPIRIWDLVSDKSHLLQANRGANGIDGQLSTAFGLMKPQSTNWIVLGDLTALYDFNGLWVSEELKHREISVNLIVSNNGGGQIFSRIFDEKLFRNEHQVNFKPMAEMWGWNYHLWKEEMPKFSSRGLNLIELQPNCEQSEKFWQEYDQLWKK